MVNMGERIKTLRNKNNLTQSQVAQRLGVANSAVSAYESGTRYPTYETLIKLARMYHVSTDYLLGVAPRKGVDVNGLTDEQTELLCRLADEFRK